MDEVFKALADPSRRELLDRLNGRNGQTLRELCEGLGMARQSVSKHLAILEGANLITAVWRGREKLHFLNPVPITALADRWITQYDRERSRALADLKTALEDIPMSTTAAVPETPTTADAGAAAKPEFVYTIFISTTPERLWRALTEPAFTKRYWGVTFQTDWQPGSPVVWEYAGVTMRDPEQVVLEADPPRKLTITWHAITPEFARATGFTEEQQVRLSAERRSRVTFLLELAEGTSDRVKLTVIHAGFDPGSALLEMVSGGWPEVLSDLKTLLETGDLPASAVAGKTAE
ncbi:MAG TPA: SRPBCC domain-containing protein [Chloroflexota bacterium]|nr:SRPBCC domain-containing protein [Chloroflexota bacterium]